jgi:phage terminase small subunit
VPATDDVAKEGLIMALTDKQQRFVDEYLIDLNATQAAIRAGYSQKTAQEQASRLLSNVMVSKAIEEAKKARESRTEVTQDWVVHEMVEQYKVANQRVPKFSFGGDQVTDENGNPVFVQVDAAAASKALDMLAKHTGAYERDNKREFAGGLKIVWGEDD